MKTARTQTAAHTYRALLVGTLAAVLFAGCAATERTTDPRSPDEINARHRQRFGDAELPRRVGTVKNVGLQLPVISPDGRQLLYLSTDQPALSPMTVLGADDPNHTPPDGGLSVYLGSVGGARNERVSSERWAHSPIWSPQGRALAYVAHHADQTRIVHVDIASGQRTDLGVPGAVNCLPRFDQNDTTLLFCTGPSANGPFQVARQSIGQTAPDLLTPTGYDCLFPIRSDGRGNVLCAAVNSDHLDWVRAGPDGTSVISPDWGTARRPGLLQTWAGIGDPLSPDGASVLYYDVMRDRVGVLHIEQKLVRWHRRGTIAGCWIDDQTVALATREAVFVVNTTTGMSIGVFNGQWIPVAYVPAKRRLLLLGADTPQRFAIWEVVFTPEGRTP